MADMAKGYTNFMNNNLYRTNATGENKYEPVLWNTADIMRVYRVGRNKALGIKRKVCENYPDFWKHARYVYADDVIAVMNSGHMPS